MKAGQTPDNCPKCGVTWLDPTPTNCRAYRRSIAVYDRDKDCTVALQCPECGTEFPRDADEIGRVKQ